jgi:hypothetical protein
MRVVMANPDGRWSVAAREAGASEALVQADALLVTSRAEDRMKVLRAIETAGGRIARFATEELSLEDIYLNYIHADDLQDNQKH